ncbi:MAG: hypothetical protein QOI20_1447 [Acidimicrobiaceae bacterium]|nr:hypothetical protein [Acidimicrobiaceae bacterium]
MSPRHVVVDGSNIATEGRSLPSLSQLDEAVREFRAEYPDDIITVVVDATFGHRIDPSELDDFKEAEAHNEVVSPPAGAIGRGDAFLLRIAERVGATVLSNDSFQEFHGEHEWLFDKGRLIGGKPVPGIGWIFTPRTPVRGPKSREAVKVAKRAKKADVIEDTGFDTLEEEVAARRARGGRPPKATKAPKTAKAAKAAALDKPETADREGRAPKAEKAAKAEKPAKVSKAIAMATEEAVEPDSVSARRRRRRRGGAPPAEPLNAPLTFIEFVSAHQPGMQVDAVVERFSSHGAFANVGDAVCYIPLSALGDPAPRAAREVLSRGETRTFVVQALDPPRRGIELALPQFAHVAATVTEETVEEEIAAGHAFDTEPLDQPAPAPAPAKRPRAKQTKKAAAPAKKTAVKKAAPVAKKKAAAPAKKAAPKKAAPAKKKAAPAKKKAAAPAKTAAPVAKKKAAAPAKKAAPVAKKKAAPAKTAKKPAKKSPRPS